MAHAGRETERNIDWTRRTWSGLQRFSDGSLYLNFPGLGEEGERLVRSALGEANFGRLAEIKARYDPANFFRVNLNIPPPRAAADAQSS